MAIEQSPMSRQISLPTQNVSTGNGLSQLSNATQAIGQLVTERINEVAIGKAAIQGASDVQEGRQPEKLALPFTKATKAYNDAVSNTEARRMVQSAEQLINESLTNSKNPATFNRGTPAQFHSQLEGIKSGILENARDENREQIREALDRLTAHASLNMLQHSIEFDNRQTKFDMQKDISGLLDVRRNAVIAGDAERVAGIDAALEQSIGDYSTMNAEIARIAPYLKEDIAKHKAIDSVLAGYSDALHNKTTEKYLYNLAENKENLPFDVWQEAVKAVVSLDQTESRLKNDVNGEQWAQADAGIDNGSIQSLADIDNYQALTSVQKIKLNHKLELKQAAQFKQGAQLITAQQNILSDRPTWNSADTKNKMFKSQVEAKQQQTGQPVTLQDMGQIVLGQSEFPASGIPGVSMGTNVPAFDSILQGKLTSGNPTDTAQAALTFQYMVDTKGQPGSVNLTGDALTVATLFGELYQGGTTPEEASELAINAVLNAKEPEIAQRIERFNKTLAHVNPSTGQNALTDKFKDAFGSKPQAFVSDQGFKLFTDIYRAHYISSNSEEGAFKATKYAMQKWGTSKYFDKGYVGQPVPEKEVPIASIANAFPNQIVSNVQGYINRTNAAREAHPDLGIPVIEWADPKQTITGNESENDKVFKKMTLGNLPRIKINGHETDVVLIPSATSRLGGGVSYLLGVYDQFNNLNPLKDVTNGVDQVARFAPKDLSLWAPEVATQQDDAAIRKYAQNTQAKEDDIGLLLPIQGLAMSEKYLQYVEKRKRNSSEERLGQILESLKGKKPESVRNEIADADNVGISPSLIPSIGGSLTND